MVKCLVLAWVAIDFVLSFMVAGAYLQEDKVPHALFKFAVAIVSLTLFILGCVYL